MHHNFLTRVIWANEKNTTTEAIRTTCRKITAFINKGKQSVRAIGWAIDRPKSTVHRHLHALDSRNQHPESYLWEFRLTRHFYSWHIRC